MRAPSTLVVGGKASYPLFQNRWPDHIGEDVGCELRNIRSRCLNLAFLSQLVDIIQRMRDLNPPLHRRSKEPIHTCQPPMQSPTTSHQRRLDGLSGATM